MIYGTPVPVFVAARKLALTLGMEAEYLKTGGLRISVFEMQRAFPKAEDKYAQETAKFISQSHPSGEWQIGTVNSDWVSFYSIPKPAVAATP